MRASGGPGNLDPVPSCPVLKVAQINEITEGQASRANLQSLLPGPLGFVGTQIVKEYLMVRAE
jgi:hypothetical protein